MLAIGLMSGTSLDGIDAALVEVRPGGGGYAVELRRFATVPYEPPLLDALRAALPPNAGSVELAARLHRDLGRAYAAAAAAIRGKDRIDFVASHGQTLWHDGAAGATLQAGDPFAIREALETTVCFDFRSADCAAGGQGAPLIPYVDAMLLGHSGEDRVALNLGGIANVTLLAAAQGGAAVAAFDTGPGNMLLDAFVRERTGGASAFDEGGSFAAAGRADAGLLATMLGDDYFAQPAPKSTGRERFGAQFLARHERLRELGLEDGAATLTQLTAASVADAIDRAGFGHARVLASGGGARNPALLAGIAARLPRARVESSDAMGIPVDAKEAMGFALLGYETLRGRAANVPRATGAARAVPLGAIAPWNLGDLLARMERECATASR